MAFDKNRFLRNCDIPVSAGSAVVYTPKIALAVCDELERIDDEIAALKAAMPMPEPQRETGLALVDKDGDPYTTDGYAFKQNSRNGGSKVVWFSDEVAKAFCDTVCAAGGSARAALLYKDTLEEVENA